MLRHPTETLKHVWEIGDYKTKRVLGAVAILGLMSAGSLIAGIAGSIEPINGNDQSEYANLVILGGTALGVAVGTAALVSVVELRDENQNNSASRQQGPDGVE